MTRNIPAMRLDERGQCPVCLRKPRAYKRWGEKWCFGCHRQFDINSGEQVEGTHWMQAAPGVFQRRDPEQEPADERTSLETALAVVKAAGYRISKPRTKAKSKRPALNALGLPMSPQYDPNYRLKRSPTPISRLYAPQNYFAWVGENRADVSRPPRLDVKEEQRSGAYMMKNAPGAIHIMLPTEPPLRLEVDRGVPREVVERSIVRAGLTLTPAVKTTLDLLFANTAKQ